MVEVPGLDAIRERKMPYSPQHNLKSIPMYELASQRKGDRRKERGSSGLTRRGNGRSSQITAVEVSPVASHFMKSKPKERLYKTPVRNESERSHDQCQTKMKKCPPIEKSHVAVGCQKLQRDSSIKFHDSGTKEVKASRAVRSSLDDLIIDVNVYPGNKKHRKV